MQNLSQPSCTVTKARDPAFADFVRRWRGEVIELAFGGKIRVENRARGFGAAQKLRQAMIALRPDDDIHGLLAPENLLALRPARRSPRRRSWSACPASARAALRARSLPNSENTFSAGALPDVAGVQDHKIGVFQMRGLGIAFRREDIGHPLRIIDIHLTAVRLHEQPAGGFHRVWSGFARNAPGGTRLIEFGHCLPWSTRRSPLILDTASLASINLSPFNS